MKNILTNTLLLIFTLLFLKSYSQSDTNFQQNFEELIKTYEEHRVFNGVVLVAKDGKVVFKKSIGKANLEWDIDNSTDTHFIIGSLSKSFTATLAIQLAQEKKISLEDPVSKYLPNFPKEKGDKITVHHLISNTSGIPNYFRLSGWTKGEFNRRISQAEFITEIAQLESAFEPGSKYMYSNSGYYLLGIIIEKVCNMTFEEALRYYVLKPLKMNDTGVFKHKNVLLRKANGYRFAKTGGYRNQNYMNLDLFIAAGNMYSTVDDLLKFDQAFYEEKLLSNESKKKLFNPKFQNGWTSSTMKLNGSEQELKTIGYNGQIEGYSSIMTRFPDDNNTIIVLTNTGMGYEMKKKFVKDLASILYKHKSKQNKLPLSFLITEAIFENSIDEVMRKYELNKTHYSVSEELINDIAQQLKWSGLSSKAIKVYKINTQLFSDSPTANFRLAEAYKENNKTKAAIPYYEKVLVKYPDNQYVKQILKQLKE